MVAEMKKMKNKCSHAEFRIVEKENRALKMQLEVYEEEYENIEIIKEKFEKISRENQDFMTKLKEAEDKYKEVEQRTHDVIKRN